MTLDEDRPFAAEWVRATSRVTFLLKRMAAGDPVDPDEVRQARIQEAAALSRFIAEAIARATGASLPTDMYGVDQLVSEVEDFLNDEEDGPDSDET